MRKMYFYVLLITFFCHSDNDMLQRFQGRVNAVKLRRVSQPAVSALIAHIRTAMRGETNEG